MVVYMNAPKFRHEVSPTDTSLNERIAIGPSMHIDWQSREVHRDGQTDLLTPKEFELLELLVSHQGKIVERDGIHRALWKRKGRASCQANLKQLIMQLRRKIEQDPSRPRYLLSAHGIGYRLKLVNGED